MKRVPYYATPTAILQFLELVEGVDVEAARTAIERRVDFADEHDGPTAVIYDGLKYVLRSDAVVAIRPANQASIKTGRVKR